MLDVRERRVEESAGNGGKAVNVAGGELYVRRGRTGRGAERVHLKQGGQRARRRQGGVDDGDVGADDPSDHRREERIVRTAEKKGVDVTIVVEHRRDLL